MSDPVETPVEETPVEEATISPDGEITLPVDDGPEITADPEVEAVGVDPEPSAGMEPPKGRYQARIDDLTRLRRDSDRRANSLANELTTLKASLANEKEPKEDDFPEYKDFVKAMSKYVAKQEKVSVREEDVSEEIKAANAAYEEIQTAMVLDAVERFEGFGEKATVVSRVIGPKDDGYHALFESPKFAEIVMHLADNANILAQVGALSGRAQVREILRLELEMNKPKPKLPKPAEKKVSKAPPPIATPKGRSESQKDLKDMSTADYIAARRAQIVERKTAKR